SPPGDGLDGRDPPMTEPTRDSLPRPPASTTRAHRPSIARRQPVEGHLDRRALPTVARRFAVALQLPASAPTWALELPSSWATLATSPESTLIRGLRSADATPR